MLRGDKNAVCLRFSPASAKCMPNSATEPNRAQLKAMSPSAHAAMGRKAAANALRAALSRRPCPGAGLDACQITGAINAAMPRK